MESRIYLRADGNSEIGHGHVARLLALANLLDNLSASLSFVLNDSSKEIIRSINNIKTIVINNEEEFFDLIDTHVIVVLDSYRHDINYHKKIKALGAQLVYYDDLLANQDNVADVIINVGGNIDNSYYVKSFYTQVYSGPEYAVINEHFLQTNSHKTKNSNLLISFGGSDIQNYTGKVLEELTQKCTTHFNEFHIVVGSSYLYLEALENLVTSIHQNFPVFLHRNLSAKKMADIMAKSGSALLPPSTMAYEYAYVGGQLYLYQTANNQSGIFNYMLKNRLALTFEDLLENRTIEEILTNQWKHFNGVFKLNIIKVFKSLLLYTQLETREATYDDCELYFNWANDPEVRIQSFNSEPIQWEIHQKWFHKKIDIPQSKLYVVELNGFPIGQVRFDVVNGKHHIDYSLSKQSRGQGLGVLMMKNAILKLTEKVGFPIEIVAKVKNINYASRKVFERLNFKQFISDEDSGHNVYILKIE